MSGWLPWQSRQFAAWTPPDQQLVPQVHGLGPGPMSLLCEGGARLKDELKVWMSLP